MAIEVTVPPRDYSVTASDRHTEYAEATEYLVDVDMNYLVDEDGNFLVSDGLVLQNIYVVYAPARDYSVTVPQVTNG